MKANILIDDREQTVNGGLVSVDTLYEIAECGEKQIFLDRENDAGTPLFRGEHLVLRGGEKFSVGESAGEGNPHLRNAVEPGFNSKNLSLPKAKTTGKSLKEFDGEFPEGRLFIEIEGDLDVEITDDMTIVVQERDLYFVVPQAGFDGLAIIVEECGKHGRRVPLWKGYVIRIDGENYMVDSPKITGAAILELAGKTPEEWSLNQKLRGGKRERIEPASEVDLTRAGIERFETIRKHAQQGQAPYDLMSEDVEYLEGNYPSSWEKISEGNGKYGLLIRNFPLPGGYVVGESTLMVLIPSGYPGSGLDMFYFDPPLSRSDGSAIVGAEPMEIHFARQWQRWSRHYDWKPGIDDLVGHIEYVKNELKKEVS